MLPERTFTDFSNSTFYLCLTCPPENIRTTKIKRRDAAIFAESAKTRNFFRIWNKIELFFVVNPQTSNLMTFRCLKICYISKYCIKMQISKYLNIYRGSPCNCELSICRRLLILKLPISIIFSRLIAVFVVILACVGTKRGFIRIPVHCMGRNPLK